MMAAAIPTTTGPAFATSGKNHVTLIRKSEGGDGDTRRLLEHIFQPAASRDPITPCTSDEQTKPLEFSSLCDFLDEQLQSALDQNKEYIDNVTTTEGIGRLGPPNVVFDCKGNLGTLVIEAERLGLASHSNFSSIRANSCVFKGKWIYELMLGSRGVMQLGWCTASCLFTQEEGVGDTDNSYAYDGNRLRKWNMKSPQKYGEIWLTGDVISCAIDCDEGTISFYRNGRSMGEAFDKICLGPGMAYFPAVSLSMSENLRANFGATPLRYPIPGYRPLQDPPAVDLIKAQHLFEYLERTVPMMVETMQCEKKAPESEIPRRDLVLSRSRMATLMMATAHIFEKLAPLLKSAYIVEAGFLKFLLQFCEVSEVCGEHLLIQKSLDIVWSFMQETERKPCLDYLMMSLVSAYRFSPATPDFGYQLTFLMLTYAILKHEVTRKYMIKNVLFTRIKFPTFLHVKPPDDEGLAEIIPDVCLDLGDRCPDTEEIPDAPEPSEETLRLRQKYFESCEDLRRRVAELEYMQVEILKLLLINTDNKEGGASTRFVFLHKFREFLRENFPPVTRMATLMTTQCPLSVSLCLFHRLIRAIRHYWDEFYEENPGHSVPSNEAFIPCQRFYDDTINYFDLQRLGGLLSHLKRTHKDDVKEVISPASEESTSPHHLEEIANMPSLLDQQRHQHNDQPISSQLASSLSLVELLDGAILLYKQSAHKQLAKMCSLRDTVHEYVDALNDTEKKMTMCPDEMPEIVAELQRSKQVFLEKGSDQVRQMAWVVAVIYAQEKQEDVYWLLQVILRTVSTATLHGNLFSFMPDFYLEACIHGYQALRSFFHPTRPYTNLPGFSEVLGQYATFLSEHFADDRIVYADSKDSLIQALACFVCYQHSLRALENTSETCRWKLTKALLAPYENRSWAQTNWILVRFWKGRGFGFRYTNLPHMSPSKAPQQDHIGANIRKPCPSPVFQNHIAAVMGAEPSLATKFIDTVLTQLNWAFSEFIGMLQELQSIASRPTAAFIDSRQLKICATCFDISVALLRVLEMLVAIVPEFFTDWSRPLAEQLLCRLCQLLTQVLNRVTSKSNTFDMVVAANIPGLETIDHFPVIAAVTGILVQLMLTADDSSRECATQALLAEPGFQISCLEFLTSGSVAEAASLSILPSGDKKTFSYTNYKDHITEEELLLTDRLVNYAKTQLVKEQKEATEIDEDALCEICYARPKSVQFLPCGHQSCKSCITHQMMNKKECFFCKAHIKEVIDTTPKTPTNV